MKRYNTILAPIKPRYSRHLFSMVGGIALIFLCASVWSAIMAYQKRNGQVRVDGCVSASRASQPASFDPA